MKKLIFTLAAVTAVFFSACGVSSKDYEAALAEKAELETKVSVLTQQNYELKAEKEALTAETKNLAEENKALKEDKKALTSDKETLTSEKTTLKKENDDLKKRADKLVAELVALENVSLEKAASAMGTDCSVTDFNRNGRKVLVIWRTLDMEEIDNIQYIAELIGNKIGVMMVQDWYDYDKAILNFEVQGYGSVSTVEFSLNDESFGREATWVTEEE